MDPMEMDECEIKVENEEFFENIDDYYCRCCFEIFKFDTSRNQIDEEFLDYIQCIFQSHTTLKGGSRWICSDCQDTVKKFWKFKKEFSLKQEKFKNLMRKGEHETLSKIQELSTPKERLRPEEIFLKEEPTETSVTKIKKLPQKLDPVQKKKKIEKCEPTPQKKWSPNSTLFHTQRYVNSTYFVLPKNTVKVKKCRFCKKYAKDMPGHLNQDHGQSNIFKCSGCDYTATKRLKVQVHIRNIHLKMRASHKYECEICRVIVTDINKHYPVKHKGVGKNYSCSICGVTSYVAEAIKIHYEKFHQTPEQPELENEIFVIPKKKKIKCMECSHTFEDIISHQIRKHGLVQKFRCSENDFSADSREKVQKHIKDAHKPPDAKKEKQTCQYCGLLIYYLDDHIANVHEGVKNFFCDRCSFSSFKKMSMKSHILNCHLPKSFSCSRCDFKTINRVRLRRHEKNQHEESNEAREKLIKCPVTDCQQGMFKENYLEIHIRRVHRREQKVKCKAPGCDRMFFWEGEMIRHFNNLHGPRNILCTICGATFGTEGPLKEHFKSHTEGTLECGHCSMKFHSKAKLQYHILASHTFEKNFKCDYPNCSAAYSRKPHLDRHIEEKHLLIKYDCQVTGCDLSFIRLETYKKHLVAHKEITDTERENLKKKLKKFRNKMLKN